jgi:hypothetical protein
VEDELQAGKILSFNGINSHNAVEGKWADNFQFANPFILNCISWVYEYGYGIKAY